MKKLSTSIALCLFMMIASHQADAQLTVSGFTLPATVKAGNNTLQLNGGGVRVKFFMDIYVAGLYTTAKSNNAEALMTSNDPAAIKIHIVSGMATSDRMVDAVKEGFKKSTGDKTAPLQTRIDKFIKVFSQEAIVKGNEFDLMYNPGEGVKVYKNGKLLDTIEGQDFKTALWGIWLGNDPADAKLKTGMLGGK